MIYTINDKPVTKEQFEIELEKRIIEYKPYSEYWPSQENIKGQLRERRIFPFPIYDKRYGNDNLKIKDYAIFKAVEEEIIELEKLILDNEYDVYDDDALQIAVAIYDAGYRKIIQ